ncbi:MAG: helix-turn-helix transcriptional regulator [Desulfobacteraceae bacterium]
MEKSGLNRNQVSKISGISNTYLTKIERTEIDGNRINIKRKTLINIAISLNLSLDKINELLNEYGHSEVSTSDTPYFLAASENQTITGILPVFSSLSLEWLVLGIEKILSNSEGATLIYVLDQPNHAFKSQEHASFISELNFGAKISPVYKDLVGSACVHRKKLITEALGNGNSIRTYICSNCLVRYMRSWEQFKGTKIEEKYKMYLTQHIKTLLKYLEDYPDQYQIKLLNKCPRLRYELLYLNNQNSSGKMEKEISKVFFSGRESVCNKDVRISEGPNDFGFSPGFGDLIGFATDLRNILDFFHKHHAGLDKHFVNRKFDEPARMVDHITILLSKYI